MKLAVHIASYLYSHAYSYITMSINTHHACSHPTLIAMQFILMVLYMWVASCMHMPAHVTSCIGHTLDIYVAIDYAANFMHTCYIAVAEHIIKLL